DLWGAAGHHRDSAAIEGEHPLVLIVAALAGEGIGGLGGGCGVGFTGVGGKDGSRSNGDRIFGRRGGGGVGFLLRGGVEGDWRVSGVLLTGGDDHHVNN